MEKGFLNTLLKILKLSVLSVLIGLLGGLVATGFALALSLVTEVRLNAPFLVLLLPLGSILTVLLYRFSKMQNYGGTNEIILSIASQKPVRPKAAPLIFVSSAVTHLLGGSAGREGAALQLGGAGAAWVARVLRLNDEESSIVSLSGMSAVFAGLFGTPLTAAVFVLEFKSNRKTLLLSILPSFISSLVAAKISSALITSTEVFHLSLVPSFSLLNLAKIVLLSVLVGILGKILCVIFLGAPRLLKRFIKNPLLSTALAAAVLVALTALVGDMRYNGSGIEMAIGAVEGHSSHYDFLLKMLFTALTLAAGLKGGAIVPTFCIGATFGCVLGGAISLSPGFAAALGLIGLFCVATNSPISAVFLGVELFGVSALPYFIVVCLIIMPISARNGLFKNRFFAPIKILDLRPFKSR